MQMILKFQPDRPLRLPFNYQYQLQSAIYAKLEEIDVSDFWHDEGFGESRKFKAFTFSPLRGKKTEDKANSKLLYEGGVSLELRSPVFSFCDDMQRALELNPIRHSEGFDRNWAPFWTFWECWDRPDGRTRHSLFWHLITWHTGERIVSPK